VHSTPSRCALRHRTAVGAVRPSRTPDYQPFRSDSDIGQLIGAAVFAACLAFITPRANAQRVVHEVTCRPATTPPAYEPRVRTAIVYDNFTGIFDSSDAAPNLCVNILEDVSFAPGPWASAAPAGQVRTITEISYGLWVYSGFLTVPEDVLFIFWRAEDVRFEGWTGAGSEMFRPDAEPFAVLRVPRPLDFYYRLTSDLSSLPDGGIRVPDGARGFVLHAAWVQAGYTPARFQDLGEGLYGGCNFEYYRGFVFGSSSMSPSGENPAVVGSTQLSYGRDMATTSMCPSLGRFIGNGGPPAAVGDVEHRWWSGNPARGLRLQFRGTVPSCGTADFNRDGVPGDDADIAAFFGCLAGNCCQPCESVDFNDDGDAGTDQDIEAFFRVLAGMPC
jgi:hypothetical protein